MDTTNIPTKPGCYLYLDTHKKVIYVGKAKNLKKRVSSYFQKDHADSKTQMLVTHISQIDFVITDNEVEALLLESSLIRQFKPKFNIDLKDTERYAYITVTDESFPRLMTARKKNDRDEYFGPFVDGYSRVLTVKTLNESFQLRTCKTLPKTVCLNYHLGLCSGPCQGFISKEDYAARVKQARSYLTGKGEELLFALREEMKKYAGAQQFESAKLKRDQIRAIESLQERQKVDTGKEFDQDIIGCSSDGKRIAYFIFNIVRGTINKKDEFDMDLSVAHDVHKTNQEFIMQYYATKIPPKEIVIDKDFLLAEDVVLIQDALSSKVPYKVVLTVPQIGDKAKLLELAQTNADYGIAGENPVLIKLKDLLNLPTIPLDIECFDISNLGDDYIVGAKIHYTKGVPNKECYRKYRIKWGNTQNDFAAMYEVLKRRFYPIMLGNEAAPDLIVIDGGKGQLGAAVEAMKESGLRIPMIALAKQEEEIYFPGLSKPLKTYNNKDNDSAVKLLLAIRNETHRFVISYHRNIRDKIVDE